MICYCCADTWKEVEDMVSCFQGLCLWTGKIKVARIIASGVCGETVILSSCLSEPVTFASIAVRLRNTVTPHLDSDSLTGSSQCSEAGTWPQGHSKILGRDRSYKNTVLSISVCPSQLHVCLCVYTHVSMHTSAIIEKGCVWGKNDSVTLALIGFLAACYFIRSHLMPTATPS